MNGLQQDGFELARRVVAAAGKTTEDGAELVICPPAVLLAGISAVVDGTEVAAGGQDCHAASGGAHTGDISADMLADVGATYVIIGHSERRQDHGESSAEIRSKLTAAHVAGLNAIVCIGETLAERDAGQTFAVLSAQLDGSLAPAADIPVTAANTIVAYEPVWAIGTGRTPTHDEISATHAHIRSYLATLIGAEADRVRLLYGGSVKPGNAADILAITDVDGALVGGASLNAEDFCAIGAAVS